MGSQIESSLKTKIDPIRLETITENYRKKIPETLATLRKLLDNVKNNLSDETLKALKFQIHKLAGNAGVYGYVQVSEICKEFDSELSLKIEALKHGKDDLRWINHFECYLEKIEEGFFEEKH